MAGGKEKYGGSSAIYPWALPGLMVLVWYIVGESGLVPGYLLPSPMEIGRTGYIYILGDRGDAQFAGRFLNDALVSTSRVLVGFSLAALCGIPLGILSGRVALFNRLLSTTVNALRSVPGIAWLPLAMIWFGIGVRTTTFLVATAAFFPIYLNTSAGARQVNPLMMQVGKMMGIGRLRRVFAILLPCVMPNMIAGLRLGLGIAWAYLVLGELTGVPDGLGAVIMDARMQGRIDIIIVGIVLIAFLGRLSDTILKRLMRSCFKSARRMI